MTTLNITVFNNKVLIDNPVIIPEGNLNTIFATFVLPDEWNGLTAKVKFGDIAPITIPSSKTVAIPLFEIKGDVSVKVFAYSLLNDEYSLIHSPAPSQITICEGSFDTDGETPTPPTPTHEYLDKTTLWGGYSAYFGSLTDAPADAVAEFESVNISTMTLEEVVTEIEVINKIILDDHSGGVTDVLVNDESVVYNGVAIVTVPVEGVTVNGSSVVDPVDRMAKVIVPNIPVEDVKVNGASVVNNKVANVTVPDTSNLVTTNTDQEISATKSFIWNGISQGVTKTAALEIDAAAFASYYAEESQSTFYYNSCIIMFPNHNRSGLYFLFEADGDRGEYTLPMPNNGDMLQIATTADIYDSIEDDKFYITFSKDVNDQWVCNKTFAEIEAAIAAKKNILAIDTYMNPHEYLYLFAYNQTDGYLGFSNAHSADINSICSNTISFERSGDISRAYGAIIQKNQISASIPSSFNVPTESAVVSYVSGLVGDIDTILNTINGEVI